jgi:hypothetical protein
MVDTAVDLISFLEKCALVLPRRDISLEEGGLSGFGFWWGVQIADYDLGSKFEQKLDCGKADAR